MPSDCEKNYSEASSRFLYEYAVVQFVPSIERGEFINIGLVMMCKRRRWLRTRFAVSRSRISAFCPDFDVDLLMKQIAGFERVGAGDVEQGGDIASLDAHERFRWLTAVRSASLQTSRPHAGITTDLDATFADLFHTLVE